MHLHDALALVWAMDNYPPSGADVGSLIAMSLLHDYRAWLETRCVAWRDDALHGKKKRYHTVTLSNHTARSLSLYLTVLAQGNHIVDDYTRACVDMVRINITQQLA